MVKKIFVVLLCSVGLIIFTSTLHGQGSKKTITLPSGEVVCDLNGEWDVFIECYGPWKEFGSYPQIVKITQKGSSVVGIRMRDDPWSAKGAESIIGELDKSGFKKVQIMSAAAGPMDSKGKISQDGNKIVIDDGEKVRQTYTRRK
jgi:hypothetical protein